MILYALQQAKEPISRPQLTHALMASADVDLFDICDAIAYLEKADEIFRYINMEGKEVLDLTKEGKLSAQYFGSELPLQVRELTVKALHELFILSTAQKRVTAKAVPVSFTDYSAEMKLREGDTELLSMTVFAKDEKLAQTMCKNYKKKHAEIYEYLLRTLSEEEKSSK